MLRPARFTTVSAPSRHFIHSPICSPSHSTSLVPFVTFAQCAGQNDDFVIVLEQFPGERLTQESAAAGQHDAFFVHVQTLGSGFLWWGERLSRRSLAKADPREPELMGLAFKIGSPVVSPHQFSSN